MLHVEFIDDISAPSGNTEGTTCYIVLVSNRMLLYEPDKNKFTPQTLNCWFFIELHSIKNCR
jgi:hypothetical protein